MAKLLLAFAFGAFASRLFAPVFYDVREYGAKGDGVVKDTAALQKAIDAAAQAGGVVVVPAGRYLCGTIHLKSRITLYLAAGATILASPDNNDFDPYEKLDYDSHADNETTYFHYALLAGENIQEIAIRGEGVIDGNRKKRGGPKPIALKNVQHISIRGITVRDSPNYAISFWAVITSMWTA
jgi:polygalacturonase